MTDTADVTEPIRPWVDHYPAGVDWTAPIDTTPVHEQILAQAKRVPHAVALDFLGAQTSFAQLGEAVETFAGALQQQFGVKKGVRVALMLPNTPFYVIAYYGVLRAGGTVVNTNPLYTVSELTHIVSNSGAEILVTLDLEQLFPKAAALVEAGHVKTLIVCNFPRALPLVKSVLYRFAKRKDLSDVRGSAIAGKVAWFHDMIAKGTRPTPVAIDPKTDVAVQQYTGGTTGSPKGAMLSHANIAANRSQIDHWGLELFHEPSKVVAVLPFFHIFAMTACMNLPLCNGIEVVMLPRFEMKGLLDLLTRTRANVLPAVPTLLHAIGKNDEITPDQLASVQVSVSGGAPLSNETRALYSKRSKALLAEGYGLTEASPVVCCAALRVPSKPMSIGQPLPGTDLRFIDIETGAQVPLGQRGELQVRGPQVMLGYFNNDAATAEAFAGDWLRTGDVGYVDEDGYVFLVDRIKDLIICSGFNVYPRVIEEALMSHPSVDEVTVIGVPDEYRGEAPVAYIKLKADQVATSAEMKAFLTEKLNKIEMPREIIFKDALPKTLIGKLSKKELRQEYQETKGKSREPA